MHPVPALRLEPIAGPVARHAGPRGRGHRPGTLCVGGCGCGEGHLTRARRSPWMRLLPLLRLYKCMHCGCRVLRPKLQRYSVYPCQLADR